MSRINILIITLLFSCYSFASNLQVTVVDKNNKPLEDIVVYLEPIDFNFKLQKVDKIEISQKSKAFIPYISVIQKDQPVNFNNQDEITHHIFSATKQHSFSFKIRSGSNNHENTFNKPGNISMGCNIHDWMSGYLLVLDTPYFAKTDQQGKVKFSLNELTSDLAKIKVSIWHPQLMEDELNRFKLIELTTNKSLVSFKLNKPMEQIPQQESGEDFDFLDSY